MPKAYGTDRAVRRPEIRNPTTFKPSGRNQKPKIDVTALREREGIDVVRPEEEEDYYSGLTVPECPHGLCLLFRKPVKNADHERWFGCALHRTSTCTFRANWPIGHPLDILPKVKPAKIPYRQCLPDKIASLVEDEFYFCTKCLDIFPSDSHYHAVQGPYQKDQDLLELLPALQDETIQAQFWFSEESMEVLLDSLQHAGMKEFICVGTPRFFSYAKQRGQKVFLLDMDERFRAVCESGEFAMYNMVNNQFFTPEKPFDNFLKKSKAPVIICDPPFGAFIKALIWSLKKLVEQKSGINYVITLPYFQDKHLFRELPTLKMVDYAVTYQNHKKFKFSNRSPVRFFTTIDRKYFILIGENYKFCNDCDRYVTVDNEHCYLCNVCASRDGNAIKHCDFCNRCVPAKYTHCSKCETCSINWRCHKR